jgi:hypothetical protein
MRRQAETFGDKSHLVSIGNGGRAWRHTGTPPLGGIPCLTPPIRLFASHTSWRLCPISGVSTRSREPTGPSPDLPAAGSAERDVSLGAEISKRETQLKRNRNKIMTTSFSKLVSTKKRNQIMIYIVRALVAMCLITLVWSAISGNAIGGNVNAASTEADGLPVVEQVIAEPQAVSVEIVVDARPFYCSELSTRAMLIGIDAYVTSGVLDRLPMETDDDLMRRSTDGFISYWSRKSTPHTTPSAELYAAVLGYSEGVKLACRAAVESGDLRVDTSKWRISEQ